MKSAENFYVFDKWADAPAYAFGSKNQPGIVPDEDKEGYWGIYSELVGAAKSAMDDHPDSSHLELKPKMYSRERGSRGHRPIDLWVSICSTASGPFGHMPQVYAIASRRGLELGFAVSIPEDDYFDQEVKARNRSVVPFINAKLPSPDEPIVSTLSAVLAQQDRWHFNSKTRQVPGSDGWDRYEGLADMLQHLKASPDARGGGCICRVFTAGELSSVELGDEFRRSLANFGPLIGRCSPTSWDVHVRGAQHEVEGLATSVVFDPADHADGRKTVLAEVARRQGQSKFRAALMEAYSGRCAISGFAVADVLQAAHITPYLGPDTNHVTNGLLLRADLHTLFDLGLITIRPNSFVVAVSPVLTGTEYWEFNDQPIALPNSLGQRPSPKALADHFTKVAKLLVSI